MSKVLLIDGYSIICRGFYALPLLTSKAGFHTNACLGFLNIFYKVVNEEEPDYIVLALDENKPTFRHDLYKEYKGQRKPLPAELKEQVPYIKEMIAAMNIPIISKEGYEADDILGTLAYKLLKDGNISTILSGDRDMLQLASNDIKIRLVKTMNNQSNTLNYYSSDVYDEYKVTPDEFIDVKALMGDSSDNIPGLPGVGEKTAFSLIQEYKSIDNIYKNIDNITKKKLKQTLEENKENAYFYKKLVTIVKDAPIDIDLNTLKTYEIDNDDLINILKKYDLNSVIRKIFGKNKSQETNLQNFFDKIDETKADEIVEDIWGE